MRQPVREPSTYKYSPYQVEHNHFHSPDRHGWRGFGDAIFEIRFGILIPVEHREGVRRRNRVSIARDLHTCQLDHGAGQIAIDLGRGPANVGW